MINNIQTVFSIKDLENFSGIKAHTIRIWEKRYNVLQPERTDTNIRLYDLKSLQKLLNISLLHDYGYKISKIATYPEEKIPAMVQEIVSTKNAKNHALNSLKMAMMRFDNQLFLSTYNWLFTEKSFKTIFTDIFIPFMNELGLLWQTDAISPAHEHFVTCLIKQKLAVETDRLMQNPSARTDRVFVLSLPMNEIHELGLLYINYELLLKGYQTIYLGESMPIENLRELKNYHANVTFISYLTVQPEKDQVNSYIEKMTTELVDENTCLWFIGRMTEHIQTKNLSAAVSLFESIPELADSL